MAPSRRTSSIGCSLAAAGLTLVTACGGGSGDDSKGKSTKNAAAASVREETRSLDQLYKDARAEGGTLTVYAGGDVATQQDENKAAFEKAFPRIKVNMIVDYSKFHDARIDHQLATNTLVPDVVQLQTVQDFPRWKKAGALMPYKPAGFGKVHDGFKDPDGAWTSIFADSFGLIYNKDRTGSAAPASAKDLLDPKWKGKIISTYPNDDDAVLFLYKKMVDTYGWDWLKRFAAQDVKWVRGAQAPYDEVESGKKQVALGAETPIALFPGQKSRFVVPEKEPFMSWAQRAAILKDAKHPATAKLYLNWWLSKKTQQNHYMWTVREDVQPHKGFKHVWEYPNTSLDGYVRFMTDRAAAERFRTQLTQYVGEPKGKPSPGWLGVRPTHRVAKDA
ncbi:ABC transporter substrate-binding protein [Streptomyces yatensis]|uniref:Extracellular solute-binding protein n=1 Tax=Streptomyces yatensis TaxID=155177 RepID=A0ABN2I3K4_9ACTN|nr:extracellular solute-binding protein [Streptomyces yatensis]